MFSGCNKSLDSKETELESSNQEPSPSGDKNAEVDLVPCSALKCVPIATSGGADVYEVPGCHLSFQWGSQKLLQRLVSHEFTVYLSVFNLFLNQWIMAISNGCKPDNFISRNSLKHNFTKIQGLRLDFVDCEYFLESNSPDILALCETDQDNSIDFASFSVSVVFLQSERTLLLICMVL